MSMRPATTSYDSVPYAGLAYPQTHPDRLATIATLLGLHPAPISSCRVLELGCGDGSNLIPMALALPGASFVGIDLSSTQIAMGQALVAELGLTNLRLDHANILEITPAFGQFDYIIAHGIYSWVPEPVRDALLAICQRNLAPNGVAYVSYNVYPGWHLFDPLRALFLQVNAGISDPSERLRRARDILHTLNDEQAALAGDSPLLTVAAINLDERLKTITAEGQASILLHDIMEDVNQPVYFHTFAAHASRHNLQYLAEANFPVVLPRGLSEAALRSIRQYASSGLDVEAYMDFFRGRTFRQTLLCHAGLAINRALRPTALVGMAAISQAEAEQAEPDLAPGVVVRFQSSDGATLAIDTPVSKAALLELSAVWPYGLAIEELLERAIIRLGSAVAATERDTIRAALCADLLTGYSYSLNLVNLSVGPVLRVPEPSDYPCASVLVRLQAHQDRSLTTLHHENAAADPYERHMLPLLDGQHSIADLIAATNAFYASHPASDDPDARLAPDQAVARFLRWAAGIGLLVH